VFGDQFRRADIDKEPQAHQENGKIVQLAQAHQCRAVLLSPACASFDQYGDFEARGDHFRQLVEAL